MQARYYELGRLKFELGFNLYLILSECPKVFFQQYCYTIFRPSSGTDFIISVGGRYKLNDLKTVQIYNVLLENWVLKKDLPHRVRAAHSFVLNRSKFHVLGGFTDSIEDGKIVFEYDLENDNWIRGFQLEINFLNGVTIVFNEKSNKS